MLQSRVNHSLRDLESSATQNVREKSMELFNNLMQMQAGFNYFLYLKPCENPLGAAAR